MNDEVARLLREIRDHQREQLALQTEALALQRRQFELTRSQLERVERINDRAESIQARALRVVRLIVWVALPLALALLLAIAWPYVRHWLHA